MNLKTICVLGGTGFVGQHVANHLSRAGYKVRIPSRRRERYRELLVMPTVDVVNANIHDDATLQSLFQGCSAVVNLVAVLNERRRNDFDRIHVELPRRIVATARKCGVTRLIHMSALHANASTGPSAYLRSKGRGEDLVHAHSDKNLRVTSLRPSVIFGDTDHLFNRFAGLLRWSPLFFPIVCAQARFAPIYVEDIAHAIVRCIERPNTESQRFDLCGPRVMTMEQIVAYTNHVTGAHRTLIPLNRKLSRIMATLLGPTGLFTVDNYLSTLVDSVCTKPPSDLAAPLTPIEAVVPLYIGSKGYRAEYDLHRRRESS